MTGPFPPKILAPRRPETGVSPPLGPAPCRRALGPIKRPEKPSAAPGDVSSPSPTLRGPLKLFKLKGKGNVDWLCFLAPGGISDRLGVKDLWDKWPPLDKACRLAYI